LQQGYLGAPTTVEAVVMRRCYACAEELPTSDFAHDTSKASGFKSICKRCDRQKSRAYYAQNRERKLARANVRNARLRATGRR
jgi:hypothetical protein